MLPKYFLSYLLILLTWSLTSAAQDRLPHPSWPGPGQLFVGTCYQPADRSPEQIDSDIAVMKRAGFNVVRMGDLSWDSFEPAPGQFTFEWFDHIMDKMQASGIRVIGLDNFDPYYDRALKLANLASAKQSPRWSKPRNRSNEAQAGESSTVPWLIAPAASRTA